jgi:hypothetical protein
MKRVVTGHDADGKAVVAMSSAPPGYRDSLGRNDLRCIDKGDINHHPNRVSSGPGTGRLHPLQRTLHP